MSVFAVDSGRVQLNLQPKLAMPRHESRCPEDRFAILFTDTVIGHVKEVGQEGQTELLTYFGSLPLGAGRIPVVI